MTARTALGPAQREAALRQMVDQEFDILVIGAGVVGAGIALDAATRGLSVALVEARDYASGTSSRSSKLIHGGLRYLEQLEFGLVREALRERSLILGRLAPHLAQPVPFLYLLTHRRWERPYAGSGIALYDVLGGRRGIPAHRHLSRRGALRLFPGLREDALVGAIRYYDGQVDDARHTMMLARTAHSYGAVCASSARVTGFVRAGDRITGAVVRDLEAATEIKVRARHTINATGVWSDEIQHMAGRQGRLKVRASKGIHLLVPRDRIRSEVGLISRTEKSVLFIIPWGSHWIIGTTDTAWDFDLAHPAASRADIDYLLGHVNRLISPGLTFDDIEGVYAGLRPLLAGHSDATSKLSREHAVVSPAPGLTMVAGGKYTTYRVMAKDALDAALGDSPAQPCVTDSVPLVGADGFAALWNARHVLAQKNGLQVDQVELLLRRYGSLIHELLDLIRADPGLARPLGGAPQHLRAEIYYAASHEGALHLEDILARRTRISIQSFDRGVASAREAAAIVAPVLDWDESTIRREIEYYEARVLAERESQTAPDDAGADAARLSAPDVRGHLREVSVSQGGGGKD